MIQEKQHFCDFEVKTQKNTKINKLMRKDDKEQTKNEEQEKVDYDILLKYHMIYGNKWKQISSHFENITDSNIKNMFYTLARKSLRKINFYIDLNSKQFNRKGKTFKLNFVFKLANLAQSQRIAIQKQNCDCLKGFYLRLLYKLLEIGNIQHSILNKIVQFSNLNRQQQILKQSINSLIENLRTIQKIFIQQNLTKKGRNKRKFPKKGLIQKAYSSKAFKNSMDECQVLSFGSLQTNNQTNKQNIQDEIMDVQNFQFNSNIIVQLKTIEEINIFENINELDNIFQQKSLDPALFQ